MQTLSISKNVLRDFLFFFNEKKAPFDKKKLKNKNINKQIKHKTLIKKQILLLCQIKIFVSNKKLLKYLNEQNNYDYRT